MTKLAFVMYNYTFLALVSHNCQDYIQVMDGFTALTPLCERSLKQSHETVVYNLTSPKVLVNYFITSGQMAAEQSRGFWLSYRQIEGIYHSREIMFSVNTAHEVFVQIHIIIVNCTSWIFNNIFLYMRFCLVS